ILAGHHLTGMLWCAGIDQFLAGPRDWLGTDIARARSDGQEIVDRWYQSHPEIRPIPAATRGTALPLGLALLRALMGLVPVPRRRVVLHLAPDDLTWRSTLGADVVVLVPRGGSAAAQLAFDGSTARALLAHTLRQ